MILWAIPITILFAVLIKYLLKSNKGGRIGSQLRQAHHFYWKCDLKNAIEEYDIIFSKKDSYSNIIDWELDLDKAESKMNWLVDNEPIKG